MVENHCSTQLEICPIITQQIVLSQYLNIVEQPDEVTNEVINVRTMLVEW